ncbi:hypothetical protein F2Q70_00030137 [Brassica cretica]|nr:hypothetical protein F2Q70_00030137 [Brassica cretica]
MRFAPTGGEGKALASSGNLTLRNNQDEVIRRSDIEALIKLLKDNPVDTNVIEIPHLDPEGDNQAEHNQEDSTSHDRAEHHTQEDQDHHTTQEEPIVIASQPQPNNDQVATEEIYPYNLRPRVKCKTKKGRCLGPLEDQTTPHGLVKVLRQWRCHYKGQACMGWLRSQDNGDATTRDKHAWVG